MDRSIAKELLMRIAKLVAHNFRGIRSLSWQPGSQAMSCIIGPGYSAKTTVLDVDAIEANSLVAQGTDSRIGIRTFGLGHRATKRLRTNDAQPEPEYPQADGYRWQHSYRDHI